MANRHLSRSIVLQTLFEWDFNGNNNSHIPTILKKDIEEFGSGAGDDEFMIKLAEGVAKKRSDLDKIIEKEEIIEKIIENVDQIVKNEEIQNEKEIEKSTTDFWETVMPLQQEDKIKGVNGRGAK